MNAHTLYVLIAILATVGAMSISSASAQVPPITVWTDSSIYNHESAIRVDGEVANIRVGTPVTLIVISPTNNIVTIDQLAVVTDGTFSTTLSSACNLCNYYGV